MTSFAVVTTLEGGERFFLADFHAPQPNAGRYRMKWSDVTDEALPMPWPEAMEMARAARNSPLPPRLFGSKVTVTVEQIKP